MDKETRNTIIQFILVIAMLALIMFTIYLRDVICPK